ncbi:MAG TPA: hypothetical protein VF081_02500 [Solirubrobacterales bacterium]
MGGWVKVALGVLVAALVAVLVVSLTNGDDSTSPSTATVADGQSAGSADAKGDAKKGADGKSKKDGAKSDGGQAGKSAESAAPVEEEAGFTGSSGGEEEQSSGDGNSGGSNKGSTGGGKVGGLGNATSKKSGKKKKKKPKANQPPKLDPETAAASAVLQAYMSARAAQDWPTACAQLAPSGIKSLERFAGPGRGCPATFSAIYPRLAPGTWANTMTGPIASLSANGIAIYHGSTGRDYAMPMVKEGGTWKVAALGPTVVA